MSIERLKKIFHVIQQEAAANPSFAEKLGEAMGAAGSRVSKAKREPAALDPLRVLEASGELGLRDALTPLSLDQLKAIVAEYRMDSSQLARKWTTPERLIDLISSTSVARSKKGDAFR